MLLALRVRDIGIIEDVSWTLAEGLNIITGETGAGKSLVIDAVETLLGAKPDDEIVRHGADEARIEGVFALPQDAGVRHFLREKDIEAGDGTLVVRCEVRRRGRSVIRVNDRAVPRSVLQQLGRSLVDIHGQSDHLSLLDVRRQLGFLDAFAHTDGLAARFGELAAELQRTEQELKALARDEREAARREEFLRYQVDEIARADLHEGEDEELERERSVLASAEQLKTLAYEAYRSIYGDDAGPAPSALDRLGEAVSGMRKLADLDPGMKPVLDSVEEAVYGLEETAKDVRAYGERLEHDPQRLDEIESRLEMIRDLKRKYGQSVAEVLAFGERAASDLEGISGSAERRAELEERCGGLRREMGDIASRLSDARGDGAQGLSEAERKRSTLFAKFPTQVASQAASLLVSLSLFPIHAGLVRVKWTMSAYQDNLDDDTIAQRIALWSEVNREDREKLEKMQVALGSAHATSGPLAEDDYEGTIRDFQVWLARRNAELASI